MKKKLKQVDGQVHKFLLVNMLECSKNSQKNKFYLLVFKFPSHLKYLWIWKDINFFIIAQITQN